MNIKNDDKRYFLEMVEDVKKKISALPLSSHIVAALGKKRIEEISKLIERENSNDLEWAKYPPLFLYINRHSADEILSFENDIALIVNNSLRTNIAKIKHFLNASANEARLWCGGFFEIFVKSQLVKGGSPSKFDSMLANGRESDIEIRLGKETKPIAGRQ